MTLSVALLVPAFAANRIPTEVIPGPAEPVWTPNGPTMAPPEAASGQIMIKLTRQATAAQLQAALVRHNGEILKAIPTVRIFVVSLPDGKTVTEGALEWSSEAIVALAEPDRVMHFTATPTDPLYSQSWHWPQISAPQAWDVTTGSPAVVVAVVDSGVDRDHEDLVGRMWTNVADPVNGVDDDSNGYVDDFYGWDTADNDNDPKPRPVTGTTPVISHGTHVSGIVGATANNGLGVVGHDWNCQIMAVKVGGDDASLFTSDAIAGVEYATIAGADVINMSLGGGYTTMWDDAIAQAHAAGIVIVVSAGNSYWEFTNEQWTWMSPVCNDGPFFTDNYVIGVAATDQTDAKADFSNYDGSSRSFVDVAAPGVDIWSCLLYDPAAGFTTMYEAWPGTSMAAPIVAGLAGLVKATKPAAGPDQIVQQIRLGCDNIDAANPAYVGKLGGGRVNSINSLTDQPPRAPKSISAFDTPDPVGGPEGGSITVIWSRSLDDGRGYNDVTGYDVLRSDAGAAGPFNAVATMLAPKTTLFEDAGIPDLTPYWYKVVVHDATTTSESAVAGPAMAMDDLAPPAIENLYVDDTVGDQGGSITLNWSGYTAPGDFAQYKVYRSESAFTNINDQGVQEVVLSPTLSSPSDQVCADKTVVDGTEYWYAVTAIDEMPNEEPNVNTVGPVVSSPNFSFTFAPGVSMISIGAITHDASLPQILGVPAASIRLARWDPTLAGYRRYQDAPNDPFMRHALGKAFWLSTDDPILRSIAGQPAPAGDFSVSVLPGWNMLGNPYTANMNVTGATMTVGGETKTLAEASDAGWVRDYMWSYDSFLQSYVLVSSGITWAEKDVRKGRGVFIRSFLSGTITLPRPSGAATPTQVEDKDAIAADWALRLVAKNGSAADTDNFVGVSDAAAKLNSIVSPPVQGIDLFFENEGVRTAASFGEPAATDVSCDVKVQSAQAGTVSISWPDLSVVPSEFRPVLVDKATGKKTYMRTATSYAYEADADTIREFELQLTSGSQGALVVQSMAASASSGGAQVVFTLSKDATATVDIVNIAGRKIRTLAGGLAVSGDEAITLAWDGKSSKGTKVPAGRYLVQISAAADDGQTVNAVSSLSVKR